MCAGVSDKHTHTHPIHHATVRRRECVHRRKSGLIYAKYARAYDMINIILGTAVQVG